jgi:hypothetical protein
LFTKYKYEKKIDACSEIIKEYNRLLIEELCSPDTARAFTCEIQY